MFARFSSHPIETSVIALLGIFDDVYSAIPEFRTDNILPTKDIFKYAFGSARIVIKVHSSSFAPKPQSALLSKLSRNSYVIYQTSFISSACEIPWQLESIFSAALIQHPIARSIDGTERARATSIERSKQLPGPDFITRLATGIGQETYEPIKRINRTEHLDSGSRKEE